jgi:hypothetical protein
MNQKLKLIAGPAKVSARLLTTEEMQDFGMEDLKPPLTYGLVTSTGWNFKHTVEGIIIIFDMNAAVKVFPDTYIVEEKMIIARFLQSKDPFDFSERTAFARLNKDILPESKTDQ